MKRIFLSLLCLGLITFSSIQSFARNKSGSERRAAATKAKTGNTNAKRAAATGRNSTATATKTKTENTNAKRASSTSKKKNNSSQQRKAKKILKNSNATVISDEDIDFDDEEDSWDDEGEDEDDDDSTSGGAARRVKVKREEDNYSLNDIKASLVYALACLDADKNAVGVHVTPAAQNLRQNANKNNFEILGEALCKDNNLKTYFKESIIAGSIYRKKSDGELLDAKDAENSVDNIVEYIQNGYTSDNFTSSFAREFINSYIGKNKTKLNTLNKAIKSGNSSAK